MAVVTSQIQTYTCINYCQLLHVYICRNFKKGVSFGINTYNHYTQEEEQYVQNGS